MTNTPKSDAAMKQWPVFTEAVYSRLDNGCREYGDSSFERPVADLITEVQQELEDVCGWSFIWWARFEEVRRKMAQRSL